MSDVAGCGVFITGVNIAMPSMHHLGRRRLRKPIAGHFASPGEILYFSVLSSVICSLWFELIIVGDGLFMLLSRVHVTSRVCSRLFLNPVDLPVRGNLHS